MLDGNFDINSIFFIGDQKVFVSADVVSVC